MAYIKIKAKGNKYKNRCQSFRNSSDLDGKIWNGSMYDLGQQIEVDGYKYGIDLHNAYTTASRLIFDYGSLCGNPEFEYIYIPSDADTWNGYRKYDVFALTNNKTILQYVGCIYFYKDSEGGDVIEVNTPDENYNPQ